MTVTLPLSPKVGMVSLGCPKALVDSERILSQLRSDGYRLSGSYADADVVLVNTCGFLDTAKAESLDAIGEAIAENGRVIVTGCLGHDAALIRSRFPNVLAVTGPQQYEQVVAAVHAAAPAAASPYLDLAPVKLTPPHYSYLKISEGCNHRCKFCIIPSLRGDLVSRPANAVIREAEKLVTAGTRELLVISQDTSAYGVDIGHAESMLAGRARRAHVTDLARELGQLGAWVRLHYVYPYPHVDSLISLMRDGLVLPYLDIPFQHASPSVLRAMRSSRARGGSRSPRSSTPTRKFAFTPSFAATCSGVAAVCCSNTPRNVRRVVGGRLRRRVEPRRSPAVGCARSRAGRASGVSASNAAPPAPEISGAGVTTCAAVVVLSTGTVGTVEAATTAFSSCELGIGPA